MSPSSPCRAGTATILRPDRPSLGQPLAQPPQRRCRHPLPRPRHAGLHQRLRRPRHRRLLRDLRREHLRSNGTQAVAAYLTARHIPGVTFAATTLRRRRDANHYPYHGQTIEGVRLTVTDRAALDSPELGIEILSALHHLYPDAVHARPRPPGLVANSETMAALARGDDPRAIAASWAAALNDFKSRREKYLLYPAH